MSFRTRTDWRACLFITGCAAALAVVALAAAPQPAQARVWVSVGFPFAGFYGPRPYYGYPAPYYYAPHYYGPPAYYPPAYYPAPNAYPPAGQAPSAYTPPGYGPPEASPTEPTPNTPPQAATAPAATPSITYTNKPAFTNSAGQTCREYKTTDTSNPHPVDVFGTACKQADGQWRVVN